MTIDLVISICILLIVFLRLRLVGKGVREKAYRWWYIPWAGVLYAVGLYFVFKEIPVRLWPSVGFMAEEFQAEALFALLGILIWVALLPLLRSKGIFNTLTSVFRTIFAGKRSDKQKVLPFPYYIDTDEKVRSRVGQVFYRWTVKMASVLLALVYAVFFLLVYFFDIKFYLISSFGLLGLIPLIDYYIYLFAEAKPEDEKSDGVGGRSPASDFTELWKCFVDTFDNYSVAWMRFNDNRRAAKDLEEDNDAEIADLTQRLTASHMDGIIENCDLTEAFIKMEPVFNWAEKNGRFVLVALDIPSHFTNSQQMTYSEAIAEKLGAILRKSFLVYTESTPRAALNNSIVVAPLTLLSRQWIETEWLSKIGLITVVNLFDKGVSNLYDCRKFCFILQAVNEDYQILFINPYRRGAEPSLRNTWVTRNQITEKTMRQFPRGYYQFFIGYDFEDYKARFNKILKATPNEPLYSGSELSPMALSSRLWDLGKPVTPVHYLDLAYTNVLEGKEELGKFRDKLDDKFLQVSSDDINRNIFPHLLPVDDISQDKIFSVIFDQENNAPAAYAKWMHLGRQENFSIVVSRPYLFRDYFNANQDFFISAPFAALQPHLCKSRVTLAIILLDMLRKTRVEEWDLRALLRYYYDEREVRSVSGVIRTLFDTYFSSSLAECLQTSFSTVFENGQYYHNTYYSIDIKDNVSLSYLDSVSIEDESGNVVFEILKDLLFQNYGAGQIHSFSGKPYYIAGYDTANRTLKVRAVNNTDIDTIFYKPTLEVKVSGKRTPVKEMESRSYKWNHPIWNQPVSLSFEGFETPVEVRTCQWYTFHRYSVVGGDFLITDADTPVRTYNNGKVLKVSFQFLRKPEYLERIDDIRKGLQILMYEAMQSVFPQHAQYLVISSLGEGDPDLPWIFNDFHVDDKPEDGVLSFYFIEDAHIDLGLIGALANKDSFGDNYLFRYIYDYLFWLTEGVASDAVEGYDRYHVRKGRDNTAFLRYGRESLPSYFDIDLLINFLRDFFCNTDRVLQQGVAQRNDKHEVEGACDFCGKRMKNSEMRCLSDGRMRCPSCSEDAVDTVGRFNELCVVAEDLFRRHLGIDFSTIPHTGQLVSAVALHKVRGDTLLITNGYDVRKYVGLADWDNHVFYVENGRKPYSTLGIIIHEMTHIWQIGNEQFLRAKAMDEDWVEGLAVWTDLFLMEKYSEENKLPSRRESDEKAWTSRTDEYGRGLRLILSTCAGNPYEYLAGLE